MKHRPTPPVTVTDTPERPDPPSWHRSPAFVTFEQARAGAKIGIVSRRVLGGRERYYQFKTARGSICGWYFGTPLEVAAKRSVPAEATETAR